MNNLQEFTIFAESFCTQHGDEDQFSQLQDVILLFKHENNLNVSSIESLGFLVNNVLKKNILTKRVTVLPNNTSKVSYNEDLISFQNSAIDILRSVVRKSSKEELQVTSLKSLFSLLPAQCRFDERMKFPVNDFALDLECMISAEHNVDSLLKVLESNMSYQDVAAALWVALRNALSSDYLTPLKPNHVNNIIGIINLNKEKVETLTKTLTGQTCKYNKKHIGIIVRSVWEHLSTVQLQSDLQQRFGLAVIEHFMPLIDKPVMLTDYFMSSLNIGGPNALIALQGIFNLIQKFNINYPNVYQKLYTMFEPGIFETAYKARFYYLSDIFLSSLCLPEGMVAGFIKRFSRLSLVAPPEDIVILMAFITNLLIRHPSLKYLINCPSCQNVASDPYDYSEQDPVKSNACESSLWEVKLLQEHILPSVSSSARFINDPLPSAERDLSNLLDTTSDLIFSRECKKKLKGEVPVNFEKSFSIRNREGGSAIDLWSFTQ